MSTYLTRIQVEAHAADLAEQSRQFRLGGLARTDHRRPGRLRHSMARLLVALAIQLDDDLRSPTVPAPATGYGA
jgi:hypothetical protein